MRDRIWCCVGLAGLGVLLGLNPGAALSQTSAADSAVVPFGGVTTVVRVTASRLDQPLPEYAGNLFLRSRLDIAHMPALQSGLVLQGVPGLHLFDPTGNGSRFIVSPRGFAASGEGEYVELLLDGIPANELKKGLADFNLLSTAQLGRVEVLRGPVSSLYGDLATAGVVQMMSQPRIPPWIAAHGGSFGDVAAETGAGVQRERGYLGGSAGWMESNGWRDNSRWKEGRLFGRGALHLGSGQILSATALGTHLDRRDPGPVPRAWLIEKPRAALFPRDGQQVDRLLAGLRLAGPVRGPWQHSTRVYVRAHDDDVTRSLAAALGAIEERREKLAERSAGAELEATGRLAGDRQTLQLGLEAERGALDDTDFQENRTAVAAAARMRRVKLAPFLQSVTELPGRLLLSVGARYDWFRLRFDPTAGGDSTSRRSLQHFSPRAGLNWRWSRGNVFAAASGVFKIPTLDQLYDLRRPFRRPVPLSNPRLEPQHGTSFEVGARLQPDAHTSAEVVLYRIGMREEVSFDAASFKYKNVGRSDHTGLELSLQRQWGTRISTSASYTWTDAFFRSGNENGNRINGIPAHRGVLGLDLGLPLGLGAALVFEANGSQQLDEANTRQLRGYAVTNLRLRRPFGPANTFLQVDNLFDQRYAASGYVLPFDGAEVLYPATTIRAVAGIELQR